MSAAQRQVFRIERLQPGSVGQSGPVGLVPEESDSLAEARHREIMNALAALKNLSALNDGEGISPAEEVRAVIDEEFKADLLEARKLKEELNGIQGAIADTKKEIATLHHTGVDDEKLNRMTDELGAIVSGTEQATESILSAAEEIDQRATDLAAALSGTPQGDLACDVQDQVIKIFEACNFQDLTGQRISKVVTAFMFIEDRVARMMNIWGGIESFKDVEHDVIPKRVGDTALLNGPALDDDEEVASQNDIDALFD